MGLFLVAMMVMSLGSAFTSVIAEGAEPFEFTLYFNYEWWGIRPWGEDDISAYWRDKFGVTINFMKPDTSPEDQVLQMMILSDDLPDVILMDRGATNQELCRQGVFLDLQPLMDVNPTYGNEIAESTRELLKIDGTLYAIPHWARKGPTGGNEMWLSNQNI
jgi:ABC-type glycerol-3-phosphate transport system substrate-binding protein